jgi:DNA-binding winged helix-turn-helix (wHTH) protein
LSFRGRTVVLSESQALVVARLLERFGEVVADDEIVALFGAGRASTHAEALKTSLRRIKDALAPVGLRVTRVRGAGYLVDRSP